MQKIIKIHIPVWGDRHAEIFSRITLPSFFAAGNLPYITKDNEVKFFISTDDRTKKILEQQQSIKKLQKTCVLVFEIFSDSEIQKNPYDTMTKMQNAFVLKCNLDDKIIFLNPDSLLSSNYFRGLVSSLDENTDAVVIHNFRIKLEDSFFELEKLIDQSGVLSIDERSLVSFGLKYIHDSSKCIFWDAGRNGFASWHICLKINSDSFISSMFHPHPAIIKIKRPSFSIESTIDHNFIMTVTRGEEYLKVLNSSDIGFALELSSDKYNPFENDLYEQIVYNPEPKEVIPWMLNWTDKHHRKYALTVCHFIGKNSEDELKKQHFVQKQQELETKINNIEALYKEVFDWLENPYKNTPARDLILNNRKLRNAASQYYEKKISRSLKDQNSKYNSEKLQNLLSNVHKILSYNISVSKTLRKKLLSRLLTLDDQFLKKSAKNLLFPEKTFFGVLKKIIKI